MSMYAMQQANEAAIKPKQLRQVSTGRIFNYNEHLAARNDMVPLWPGNVDPNVDQGGEGLSTDPGLIQAEQLKKELRERDNLLRQAGEVIQKREDEIAELKKQLQIVNGQLNQLLETRSRRTEDPPPATSIEVPTADRQAIINEAVREMIKENNPEDFTKSGLPMVESVEARCGIADITAEERDAAVEAYTSK